MEYALHLSEIAELPVDARLLCSEEWRDLLPAGPLRAVYFGSEFCEDLLPTAPEVERFCLWAAQAGVEPVLLTPVVTPAGLAALDLLFTSISGAGGSPARVEAPAGGAPGFSVVVNDFGVLGLLRRSHPEIRCRAGRLMNRGLRDPRLVRRRDLPDAQSDPAAPAEFSRFHALLRRHGVAALETDADLDGRYLGAAPQDFQRVLHFPYVFATTGRNCLVKADAARSAEHCFTKGLGQSCPGMCRNRQHRVTREDTDRRLWRSGNTVFFEVPREQAPGHLASADRVVLYQRPTA